MDDITRLCNKCGTMKPYDASQPRESKANGFIGNTCHQCYTAIRLARRVAAAPPPSEKDRGPQDGGQWKPVPCAASTLESHEKHGMWYHYVWVKD